MDTTTIGIIVVAAVALLAYLWFQNRNKQAPPGTYDDPDVRSGGSIGGRQSTYDDPDLRSGGSIGGRQRTRTGSRDTVSRDNVSRDNVSRDNGRYQERRQESSLRDDLDRDDDFDEIQRERRLRDDDRGRDQSTYDDPDLKSGGSFGG